MPVTVRLVPRTRVAKPEWLLGASRDLRRPRRKARLCNGLEVPSYENRPRRNARTRFTTESVFAGLADTAGKGFAWGGFAATGCTAGSN